jgi:F-type H+-transporting ATPase subunit delta
MPTSTIDGYASVLLEIARAEGDVDRLSDEMYRAAQALAGSAELREALTDPQIPSSRKQGMIEDLLGTRASKVTVAAMSLLVGSGNSKHLPEIVTRMAELAAEQQGSLVAEVRSAVELDATQLEHLEAALSQVMKRRVQAKVIVDPSVVGGLVAKVGDRVFDGTIKGRFDELREQWG